MPTIKNKTQLKTFMNYTGAQIMNDLVNQIKIYLKEYVGKNLLSNPKDYHRSNQFIESISSEISQNGLEITGLIFFDTSKIEAKQTVDGEFNQHMGTIGKKWNGVPFNGEDFISQMENYGRITSDPATNLKGLHMISETKRALNDGEISQLLIKASKERGYILTIR